MELSSAMGILMLLSGAALSMMQQHIAFLQMCRRQSFLISEAPKIGNLLCRILNSADSYFVYADKEAALENGLPTMDAGNAVKLFFKSADQTTETQILSVEPFADGAALRLYKQLPGGTSSFWTLTNQIHAGSFQSTGGILDLTIQGPNGEQITYGGGAK